MVWAVSQALSIYERRGPTVRPIYRTLLNSIRPVSYAVQTGRFTLRIQRFGLCHIYERFTSRDTSFKVQLKQIRQYAPPTKDQFFIAAKSNKQPKTDKFNHRSFEGSIDRFDVLLARFRSWNKTFFDDTLRIGSMKMPIKNSRLGLWSRSGSSRHSKLTNSSTSFIVKPHYRVAHPKSLTRQYHWHLQSHLWLGSSSLRFSLTSSVLRGSSSCTASAEHQTMKYARDPTEDR